MNLLTTMRRIGAALLMACGVAVAAAAVPPMSQPPIRHVFVIVLENKDFVQTFGPDSPAPYLSKSLTRQGVLLTQYFGTTHYSLGNYLAMISGQGGTPEIRDDCETFSDFVGSGTTADGQAIGHGCVYPASVRTLPEQLEALHKSWGGYMEDLGNDPAREAATCGAPPLNGADRTQSAQAPSAAVPKGDQYAARHNPFVYFHSLIDTPACSDHVVNLERLASDLKQLATTPEFVFISPNLCHDGHDAPCKNGEPGGLKSSDAFLKTWVPRIMASAAYQRDGLLIVTFDEGDVEEVKLPDGRIKMEFEGESCCAQQPGPNLGVFPQTQSDSSYLVTLRSFGGDRTGAVLLSPFLAPGTVSATPFNHYSLLKSLEDLYGVGAHLGYAGQPGLVGFFDPGSDLRRRAPIKVR